MGENMGTRAKIGLLLKKTLISETRFTLFWCRLKLAELNILLPLAFLCAILEVKIYTENFFLDSVTEESLYGVTTTIHEVQAVLLSMIHKDTILVGHSLESDLKATKVSFQGTI